MAKKDELRCKSIRMDSTGIANYDTQHIWKWSPDRDIKIWKVFMSLDVPVLMFGTQWIWLAKGAVDMVAPAPGPNEEEMIFAGMHITAETAAANNANEFFNFSPKYIEVEDGETVVLSTRQPADQAVGITLIIYYTT